MAAEAISVKKKYSFEEYLELERQDGARYEYHNGEVFAMAGGTIKHSKICHNITRELVDAFADKGCNALQEGVKVEIGRDKTYVYPDVVLSCNPEDSDNDYLIKAPLLIAEVLSPSTENYDRGIKSIMYRRLPSLRYYLLVSQTDILVQLYSRNSSTALFQVQDFNNIDDIILFPELDFSISLKQIYQRIIFGEKQEIGSEISAQ